MWTLFSTSGSTSGYGLALRWESRRRCTALSGDLPIAPTLYTLSREVKSLEWQTGLLGRSLLTNFVLFVISVQVFASQRNRHPDFVADVFPACVPAKSALSTIQPLTSGIVKSGFEYR